MLAYLNTRWHQSIKKKIVIDFSKIYSFAPLPVAVLWQNYHAIQWPAIFKNELYDVVVDSVWRLLTIISFSKIKVTILPENNTNNIISIGIFSQLSINPEINHLLIIKSPICHFFFCLFVQSCIYILIHLIDKINSFCVLAFYNEQEVVTCRIRIFFVLLSFWIWLFACFFL